MKFKTKGGEDWELPQSKLQEYYQTFTNIDVDYEISLAWQWNEDNPRKRKKNVQSFLTRWLTRESKKRGPIYDYTDEWKRKYGATCD